MVWFGDLSLARAALSSGAEPVISLAGSWRFALDPNDVGVAEGWFNRTLPQRVKLPGSLPAQGIGFDVTVETPWIGSIVDRSWFTAPEFEPYRKPGQVKVPFWLQPEKYYTGPAWYQRQIIVPTTWAGRRVVFRLERPHWETRVWVDDRLIGTNQSLSTPHEYDLGSLTPGPHRLTIRVDNRLVIDVGINSHSVSDHTQGAWNGIVGRIELAATPQVYIQDVQVFPSVADRTARVRVALGNATSQRAEGKISVFVEPGPGVNRPLEAKPVSQDFQTDRNLISTELQIALGETAQTWDEFSPALYRLKVQVRGQAGGAPFEHGRAVTFGLREIATDGTQFVLNGRKIFIRGTLECSIFPKTGHPPVDVASWKKVMRTAKAYGLNSLRFHSHCPPEAAFVAADELGVYLHVECGTWPNTSTTLGDGKPVDQWLYAEADRILQAYGNHPSFLFLLSGNEPGGRNQVAYLRKWVAHYKGADPRRLYSSAAGWPQIPENQFHVAPEPRIQAWGAGLKSRINARPPETLTDYRDYIQARSVPVISHEIGQWCVYPNFAEMHKYTGYLKPRNFEIFRDLLKAHHMADQARAFLLASGKLQVLCYKEDIESALRTPGMGGFQLLDLHDFPGQGTALVGVLDPFWEEKGYVTARQYSRFCGPTVPLARLPKRVFTQAETASIRFDLAHFGPAPLTNVWPVFCVTSDNGQRPLHGHWPACDFPVGYQGQVAHLELSLTNLPAPARYRLRLGLAQDPSGQHLLAENDWDLWVYPTAVASEPSASVHIAEDLTPEALATLESGGSVLLLIPPHRVKNATDRPVRLGFSSIFWNTAWTRRQAPTTLGILCNPNHPALADFPTDSHNNWQWWYLISRAAPMILDPLPPKLRPIVQVIDDWFTARRLGLVFEAKVARGRLLVCSIDLATGLDDNPVARQLRASLLRYMAGPRFRPAIELSPEQVRSLMRPPNPQAKLGARIVRATTAEPGYEAELALDGDPETFWHTAWTGQVPTFPHELVIGLAAPANIGGLVLWPRQDGNPNGWIKDYEIWTSLDGQNWTGPVAQGALPAGHEAKPVHFAQPAQAQFIRLVIRSGHARGPWASLAELELVEASRPAVQK